MNAQNAEELKRLDQLAGYLSHGISPADSGAAVGFSKARVDDLLNNEDFQALVAGKKGALLSTYMDVNKNYDEIERAATANLLAVMRINQDPDLSLKAMAVANRALRRGIGAELKTATPIEPSKDGTRVNINLSFNLIKKIQSGDLDTKPVIVEATHAEHDTATPQMLAKLMHGVHTNMVEMHQAHAPADRGYGLMSLATPMDIGDEEAHPGRPRKLNPMDEWK